MENLFFCAVDFVTFVVANDVIFLLLSFSLPFPL